MGILIRYPLCVFNGNIAFAAKMHLFKYKVEVVVHPKLNANNLVRKK